MAVNVSKTQYIIFRPKGAKINVDLENNAIVYNSNEKGKTPDLIKYSNLEESLMTTLTKKKHLLRFHV